MYDNPKRNFSTSVKAEFKIFYIHSFLSAILRFFCVRHGRVSNPWSEITKTDSHCKGVPNGWRSILLRGTSQEGLIFMTYPGFEPRTKNMTGEHPDHYTHTELLCLEINRRIK